MLDREPRKRDPNAGREPETVVRPNLRGRHGPRRLASRAGTAHSRSRGAGNREIPAEARTRTARSWTAASKSRGSPFARKLDRLPPGMQ